LVGKIASKPPNIIAEIALAWPFLARAQQPAMPVIGFLHTAASESYAAMAAGFRQGLKQTGYVEGENVAIVSLGENHGDRLAAIAVDLVRRRVAVILAGGNIDASLAAKAATSTIPIVFAHGSDPVKAGLVISLNRPRRQSYRRELPGQRARPEAARTAPEASAVMPFTGSLRHFHERAMIDASKSSSRARASFRSGVSKPSVNRW
jgi:hypothetical protein